MSNKITFEIPAEVRKISETLSQTGYENYIVGGAVRDLVLGKTPKDWDIATIATPEQIQGLFENTFYENDFGTVGVVSETENDRVKVVEVTPYRVEGEYTDFRRPDRVEWGESIEVDLARRDFTMNALAYSLEKQELIDPYEGQKDTEKKLIKTVGTPLERFREDALRMLRAIRFAAELGFAIEAETLAAIAAHKELLAHISKERVRDEFTKIVMSDSPSVGLEMCARLGLLPYIAPELERGIGVEQNQAHAYTVWEHLLRSLDHAAKKNFPLHVRLAVLFHDVAKPHTKREGPGGQPTFYGHEVVGAKLAKKTLEDLKFPKDVVDKVQKLVRWHMFFSDTEQITLSAVRRMVRNVTPELIWDLMDVRACDRIGTGRPKESPYRLRKYHSMIEEVMRDPISVKQLKVSGADIMRLTNSVPGPHIGYILEILLSEVLDDPALNTTDYLEGRVQKLHELKPAELEKLGKEAREKNLSEDEKEREEIRRQFGVK